jgi:hypothetical protein
MEEKGMVPDTGYGTDELQQYLDGNTYKPTS